MFGWGIYDFLGGVYSKQIGAFKSFFWSQLAGLISVLLLLFAITINFNIPILAIILLPIAAIVYSAGYLLFFKGFEVGNVSIVAATMNLWAVFTMLFAFIFMGQRLSTMQSLGVFMIISGVTLASLNWSDIKNHNFKLSLGVKETVLGAFFFGVFWNISEVISEEIGWLPTTLFVKFGIIVFLLLPLFLIWMPYLIISSSNHNYGSHFSGLFYLHLVFPQLCFFWQRYTNTFYANEKPCGSVRGYQLSCSGI